MPEGGRSAARFTSAQIKRINEDAPLYDIALDEARRALDRQLAELGNLRTRAVQFLAFVGSATGFMVGASKFSGPHGVWFQPTVWIATVLSFCTVTALALLLSPWTTRMRGIDIDRLLAEWIEVEVGRINRGVMLRDLAIGIDELRRDNEPKLSRVRRLYMSVICLGMLQLAAWAVLVWHIPQ